MCSGSRLATRWSGSCYLLPPMAWWCVVQVPLNPDAEDPEAYRKEEQETIDSALPLTEEETAEKEKLLQEVSLALSTGI